MKGAIYRRAKEDNSKIGFIKNYAMNKPPSDKISCVPHRPAYPFKTEW